MTPPTGAAPAPIKDDRRLREWLARATRRLRACARKTVASLLEMGRILTEVKARIGSRRFGPWVRESGLSLRTALRLRCVWATFGQLQVEAAKRIGMTLLYELAAPGVPQTFREYVVETAHERPLWPGEVRTLLADLRSQAPAKPVRAAEPPRPAEDAEAVFAADNWLILNDLLAQGDVSVHITRTVDPENGDAIVSVSVIADAEGNRRRAHSVGGKLSEVIEKVANVGRERVCRSCMIRKNLNEFSDRKGSAAGKNTYCRQCERDRVKAATQAKARRRLSTPNGVDTEASDPA